MIEWSESDELIRESVREFIDKYLEPHRDGLERGEVSPYPIDHGVGDTDTTSAGQVFRHRDLNDDGILPGGNLGRETRVEPECRRVVAI